MRIGPIGIALTCWLTPTALAAQEWPQYDTNPFVFELAQEQPAEDEADRLHGAGGIVCADLDNDGLMDFVYTVPGSIGAYGHDGRRLWVVEADIRLTSQSETYGLPGLHCPGVQVGDVDRDGAAELLFLARDGRVVTLAGATGEEKAAVLPPTPEGVSAWQHIVLCDLRGEGDHDLVLQAAPDALKYKVGHMVAAFSFEGYELEQLWLHESFGALAHGPLRVADLDGDGRDEICGFTILGPDGRQPEGWRYPPISEEYAGGASFHIDSLFIADVRPDVAGLEVVLLEEGRNYIGLLSLEEGLLWHVTRDRMEPQNAAVGEFDPQRPGMEIWCRSRHNEHQTPWVHDSRGSLFFEYAMDDVAPEGWTTSGVEEIFTIDWTGEERQLACAKERHTEGDVCVYDPVTGEFVERFEEASARLYVADISGDWREEIIVVNGDEVHVYHNDAPNPDPDRSRLWQRQHYRRNKMSWNYYSP
jgi:hypothetical protein